jgi:hypothetical protein
MLSGDSSTKFESNPLLGDRAAATKLDARVGWAKAKKFEKPAEPFRAPLVIGSDDGDGSPNLSCPPWQTAIVPFRPFDRKIRHANCACGMTGV